MDQPELITKKNFSFLLLLGILLNATAFFNDILETDGTLYASIAKHIALTNDWQNLWVNGTDWLDKPHLPFWITAISLKLLGISSFTYKLPSFIFWLAAVYYCYKLAKDIYGVVTARLATIIFITSLHVILANFDVRAEGYLTAFIIATVYHLYKLMDKKYSLHIVYAAIFCACAIMTKGIFTLITISSGFIIYWIKYKQWHQFLQLKWYLFVLLSFIFIFPELVSLYNQFDKHPEKIVFGTTNVSGLKFFFWDSQFGRFLNTGPIKGRGDLSFFIHTTLWAFLPWALLLGAATFTIFKKIKRMATIKHSWIIGGTAITTFVLFSLSKFQLPHYVVILFPFFGMITADWLLRYASERAAKNFNTIQTVLYFILIVFIGLICFFYSFGTVTTIFLGLTILVITVVILFYPVHSLKLAIIKKSVGFALLLAIFLNCFFYPSLLNYQSGMKAARYLNAQENYQTPILLNCGAYGYAFEFYSNTPVQRANDVQDLLEKKQSAQSTILFSPIKIVDSLKQKGADVKILKTFEQFHISQLTGKFLNHKTRKNVLDTFSISLITKKD
ncbi:MAG: glycosyltransferase family 39 protein [Bacteroidota bacterium]